jgi:hypothetical protein
MIDDTADTLRHGQFPKHETRTSQANPSKLTGAAPQPDDPTWCGLAGLPDPEASTAGVRQT